MKLNNLDVYATMRITQASGGEQTQALDIEFDATKNAAISNDLFKVAFYNMLNGYVTGTDGGGVTTGFKFVAYDQNDVLLIETNPTKLDMLTDEINTRFESVSSKSLADTTTDIYISKIEIFYVANNSGVVSNYKIMTSTAPANNIFAENIGIVAPIKKGIMVKGGQSSVFDTKFSLVYKS